MGLVTEVVSTMLELRKVCLDFWALLIAHQSEERKKLNALYGTPSWCWRPRLCTPRFDFLVDDIYRGIPTTLDAVAIYLRK